MNTVESKTADTILQTPVEIKIGDKIYNVAKPTTATLIAVSKHISTFPDVNIKDETDVLFEALAIASDCEHIGTILAMLILGSKNIQKKEMTRYVLGFIPKKIEVDQLGDLAKQILDELSPKEIFNYTIQLLEDLKVGFFLNNIIFLKDINLLKKTKC